jgi:hypothetical protein
MRKLCLLSKARQTTVEKKSRIRVAGRRENNRNEHEQAIEAQCSLVIQTLNF